MGLAKQTHQPITQQEITDRISIREWLTLCSTVDERCGKQLASVVALGQPSAITGNNQYQIAARNLGGVKFDVLAVTRRTDGVLVSVLVDVENHGLLQVEYNQKEKVKC